MAHAVAPASSWKPVAQLAEQKATVADLEELRSMLGVNETAVCLQYLRAT